MIVDYIILNLNAMNKANMYKLMSDEWEAERKYI